ncbi:hypothetical protein M3Y99_01814800 [Aphelenchoides fujianensis]|nr:hypothetical protein M3Y99_01814800 [Aphelenchoides fujianensis]
MGHVSAMVALYYNVICAWIQLYLFAVLFQSGWTKWSSCRNSFNTICKWPLTSCAIILSRCRLPILAGRRALCRRGGH